MPMLIVYRLQHDDIIITANMDIVRIFEKSIPPKPVLSRRYLTMVTFEKLISNELLLNFIPAITAQKIHMPISTSIKLTNLRWRLIGSSSEYENL